MSRREKIDLFLNKWVSRKLTVFAVASAGLFFKTVETLRKKEDDNKGDNS